MRGGLQCCVCVCVACRQIADLFGQRAERQVGALPCVLCWVVSSCFVWTGLYVLCLQAINDFRIGRWVEQIVSAVSQGRCASLAASEEVVKGGARAERDVRTGRMGRRTPGRSGGIGA